jgi:hypothetical protein
MSCIRVCAAQKVWRARASLGLGLQSVTLLTVLLNELHIDKYSGQEILRILWNMKVYYCVHNSLSLDNVSWYVPVHTLIPYL